MYYQRKLKKEKQKTKEHTIEIINSHIKCVNLCVAIVVLIFCVALLRQYFSHQTRFNIQKVHRNYLIIVLLFIIILLKLSKDSLRGRSIMFFFLLSFILYYFAYSYMYQTVSSFLFSLYLFFFLCVLFSQVRLQLSSLVNNTFVFCTLYCAYAFNKTASPFSSHTIEGCVCTYICIYIYLCDVCGWCVCMCISMYIFIS